MKRMNFHSKALLAAERVTSMTVVGFFTEKYPASSGNCFSVKTKKGDYRIVNFSHENLIDWRKRPELSG